MLDQIARDLLVDPGVVEGKAEFGAESEPEVEEADEVQGEDGGIPA